MHNKLILISIAFIFLLSSCVVQKIVKGEYYLSQEKHENGIRYFNAYIKEKPEDAQAHYYLGRFYLAESHFKEGLKHMKKAVRFDKTKADYHFWLGVAYSGNKKPADERKSYENALKLNPNHLKSRIYLAHTQMESRQYDKALVNYSFVLDRWKDEPGSLYNRALALNRLGRTREEKNAWKEYLDFYPSGSMSKVAVDHLNRLGDFSYRNHLIGVRTITLRKVEFEPFTLKLTKDSKNSLDFLSTVLINTKKVSIYIVAYQKNNKKLAEQRAKTIKKYMIGKHKNLSSDRLKMGWFGTKEKIKVGKKQFKEDESVNFITVTKNE